MTTVGNVSNEQAIAKAKEVAEYGEQYFGKGKYTTYSKSIKDLKEVALYFGGECWNTGGGCMVTIIPIGNYHCISLTDDSIALNWSKNAEVKTDPNEQAREIFCQSQFLNDGQTEELFFHPYCED